MSTDIVSAIATPIVDSLLVRVNKELKFWASSSEYVTDMHAKVIVLDGAVTDMDNRQSSYNRDRRMPPARVPGWLDDANEIKVRVDGIPTHGVGCFNIKTRYRAGKNSSAIVKDIDSLMKEKNEMLWTNDKVPLAMVSLPRPSTSVSVHEDNQNKNNLKSRDIIFNDALKSLEADNIETQKMALCGMGGVGKTTMMNQLEKAARDKYIFSFIVKVDVGRNHNPLDVQQKVAESIGGGLTETTIDTRADSIKKKFQAISENGKKKVLVILDNVLEVFDLKHIGLTSPFPNGFKLLLTSREETVCRKMEVKASSIYRIETLKEPEDRELFWERAGLGSDYDIKHGLYKIGEYIIKRCGGLPLALTAIASALGDDKEKDEWADALSRLNNTSVDDYNIKEVFKISYEILKEDDLKAIFLLSGLFPEGFNIKKEDLLWYGWGLKFFLNIDTIAEARRRVNTCVNKLIRSSLLIKGDHEGSVKIHDLVRDFVLSNFTEVKQGSNIFGKLKEEESYERILLKCEDTYDMPVDFNHPNLKLLMLMGNYEELKFPEDYFSRMRKLEVVAYENVEGLLLPRHSTNLRTLSIHSCRLDDGISFLEDLINLEVLSLVNCGIHKLPSKIEKLERLKLLDVTQNDTNFCIDVCVLQSLDILEELYLGDIMFTNVTFEELKMFSSKLSSLGVNFHTHKEEAKYMSFEKLERFMISIGYQTQQDTLAREAEYGTYNTNIHSFKNTLMLVISRSELLEYKINELFSKTEILYLEVEDMNHLEDFSTHPPQHTFCNLKVLKVFNCKDLTYLFTVSLAKCLRERESLEIRCCPVLKSVVKGENSEVEVVEFQKLKILYLVDLPELVSLCDPVNIVMELPQLVELHLCQLNSFTSIFHENDINTYADQSCFNTKLVMPQLEKLKVRDMQNLKEIWPCEITSIEGEFNNISMLREIGVKDCDSLVNLFPSNPMQLLGHLELLKIKRCGSIEVLFNIDLCSSEKLTSNSSLTRIKVSYSENLRNVFRIKDHVKSNYSAGLLIPGFQATENIKIGCCERFRNIVTPTTANFDMRALKDINVFDSGAYSERKNDIVENSQEQKATTSSKEEISQVGALMSVVVLPSSYETTFNFHNLREVYLWNFDGVEVVFEIESRSNHRDQSVTTHHQQPPPLLPYLVHVDLERMEKLSHVWKCSNWNEFFIPHKNQPQLSSFQNIKTIHLRSCNSIKYLLLPLMVKLLSNLEEVAIGYCESMEEVVSNVDEEMMAYTSAHNTTTILFPRLYSLTLYSLGNLKNIGPGDFTMKFPNLNILDIHECPRLENVFTYLTIESLKKLETLKIRDCMDLKVIVRKEYREHTPEEVVFPHLKSIELSQLPNLEGFSLGMNIDFLLPLLEYVTIKGCPRMIFFTSGLSTTPKLKYIHAELGKYKYNPEHGLNFDVTSRLYQTPSTISEERVFALHNLIEMKKSCMSERTLISSNELLQLQQLETISAQFCDNIEEVFEVALEVSNNESQTVVHIPKLRKVNLYELHSLKYIWKSNQWKKLEFPNLTRLYINFCNCLEHVFTCSMVSCVMQLQELHIDHCSSMKVIVKEDEDWDATPSEISFPCLRSLNLKHVWELKGFYLGKEDLTLPSLDTLEINICPEMSVFTEGRSIVPKLRILKINDGSLNVGEDINTLIVTKKRAISVLETKGSSPGRTM